MILNGHKAMIKGCITGKIIQSYGSCTLLVA